MTRRAQLYPLCVAVAALLPTAASAAEPARPYVQFGLGPSFVEGLSASRPGGGSASLNQNTGIATTGALGYAFGNGFRAEMELGYRGNDAKNVTLPGGGTTPTSLNLKADASARSYMVNGLYDFNVGAPWTPHIGFGIGAADVRVNNVGHDTPFAWQAMAGVEYPLNPNLRAGLDYKFLGTDSLKLTNAAGVQSHGNYNDHALLLTLRWSFGGSGASSQAAAVTPLAPLPNTSLTYPPR